MKDSDIVENGYSLRDVKLRGYGLYDFLNTEGMYVKANSVYLLLKAIEQLEKKAGD